MMLTDNYTAFAHLLTQMAAKVPQEHLSSLVNHSVDAMDEFMLVSACLNKLASQTNFEDLPDAGKMLSTVNCSISDLGHAVGELNRYCENIQAIEQSKQKMAVPPTQGVKMSIGGGQ